MLILRMYILCSIRQEHQIPKSALPDVLLDQTLFTVPDAKSTERFCLPKQADKTMFYKTFRIVYLGKSFCNGRQPSLTSFFHRLPGGTSHRFSLVTLFENIFEQKKDIFISYNIFIKYCQATLVLQTQYNKGYLKKLYKGINFRIS